ncbi:MAG: hypothetical protein AB7T05_12130, partial [Fimbriimonadaceae bacterium]
MTTAETFVWYRLHPRLSLGLAHLWKQNAVRYLAAVNAIPQTEKFPGLNLSAGVQGIGTGNPGYSATLEKDFAGKDFTWNLFGGLGFRSNESHSHWLGGAKITFIDDWTLGVQADGHRIHPFVTKA